MKEQQLQRLSRELREGGSFCVARQRAAVTFWHSTYDALDRFEIADKICEVFGMSERSRYRLYAPPPQGLVKVLSENGKGPH